jgi:hypothetical protein
MLSILCIFAVNALLAVKNNLIDPMKQLSNWNKGDPCTSNWTGVFCYDATGTDGYLHVRELYVLCIFLLLFFFTLRVLMNKVRGFLYVQNVMSDTIITLAMKHLPFVNFDAVSFLI